MAVGMSELRSVEAGKDGCLAYLVKDSFCLAVMDRFVVVNLYTPILRVHVLIYKIDFSDEFHSFGQDRWKLGGNSLKAIGQMRVY